MSQERWTAVDRYISERLIPADPVLDEALRASEAAGLPPINVSPAQGKFLHLLARMHRARNVLEIGTLGGYRAIWLGRALPADGHLISLELDPSYAAVARANIERAGLARVVEVRLGPALESLSHLAREGRGPFDLIFIDADKPRTPDYFVESLKLARAGAVIVVDNVVRNGAVVDAESSDASVQGIRRFNDLLATERRVSATEIQTVGIKGYDGFAIALVMTDP